MKDENPGMKKADDFQETIGFSKLNISRHARIIA